MVLDRKVFNNTRCSNQSDPSKCITIGVLILNIASIVLLATIIPGSLTTLQIVIKVYPNIDKIVKLQLFHADYLAVTPGL